MYFYDAATEDPKITWIEVWYNHQTKDWVVCRMDAEGNQIGESDYVYAKIGALQIAHADVHRLGLDPKKLVVRTKTYIPS